MAERMVTRMVRRLEHWPGADRLKDLSVFSLRTTRLQEDLIAAKNHHRTPQREITDLGNVL